MPAPVASGWSGRRVGLAPTGKAPPSHGARGLLTFPNLVANRRRFQTFLPGFTLERRGSTPSDYKLGQKSRITASIPPPVMCAGVVSLARLDRLHHALVFVFDYVAMKYKASYDLWIGKWNDHFSRTRFAVLHGRNTKGVAQTIELCGNAIDFCDQKASLMDMEIVVLGIFV